MEGKAVMNFKITEHGYSTEQYELAVFSSILDDAIENAEVFVAHAGGCFWGAGATERAAVRRAQAGHRETSGETLPAARIELSRLTGAQAFNILEKARLRGWNSIDMSDVYER